MSIYTKLLEVQKEVTGIGKDSKNPFYKSSYFDINKLLRVVKPALNKHGLLLMQPLSNVNGLQALTTMIIDTESGELVENTIPLTINDDPQKMGSAITYYRRYALQSLLGLEAKDDDGNSAITYKRLVQDVWSKIDKTIKKNLLLDFEITKPSDLKTEEDFKEFYESIQVKTNL